MFFGISSFFLLVFSLLPLCGCSMFVIWLYLALAICLLSRQQSWNRLTLMLIYYAHFMTYNSKTELLAKIKFTVCTSMLALTWSQVSGSWKGSLYHRTNSGLSGLALSGLCALCSPPVASSPSWLWLGVSAAWLCFSLWTIARLRLSLTILQRRMVLLVACSSTSDVHILHGERLSALSLTAPSSGRLHAS